MREQRGLLFPDAVDVPEQNWYRLEFAGDVTWDIDREGHEYMARQMDCTDICSSVVETGSTDGILYAAVESELVMFDGATFRAVSGADAASQQVRDPEHVFSVAESRAIKRVVKRALGIRSAETDRDDVDVASPSGVTSDDDSATDDTGW